MLPHGCWITTEELKVKLKKVQAVKQFTNTRFYNQFTTSSQPFKHRWSASKYLHWFFALSWGAPLEDDEATALQKDMRKSVSKIYFLLIFPPCSKALLSFISRYRKNNSLALVGTTAIPVSRGELCNSHLNWYLTSPEEKAVDWFSTAGIRLQEGYEENIPRTSTLKWTT